MLSPNKAPRSAEPVLQFRQDANVQIVPQTNAKFEKAWSYQSRADKK
jgi:hypothetical protein